MILRRVTARTMAEALGRVERELGRDAYIIETSNDGGLATVIARKNEKQARPRPSERPPSGREWKPGFRPVAEALLRSGLSRRLLTVIQRAVDGLEPWLLQKGAPGLPGVVRKVLSGLLPTHRIDAARIAAFVGPTGVGKTTTLAKLAARDATLRGRTVGIVTTDTFRIAAVEQLRAFAEMMGARFRVAFTPQDLRAAVAEMEDADRIYIDTSGRSPSDKSSLSAMRGLFRGLDAGVQLCLQASSRRADLEDNLAAFAVFEPQAIVVTKWDETRIPGEVVSLAIEHDVPVSFVTNGQRVPEDGWDANAARIAASLLEDA
jgi:flagellar biosynthesis protein FlhF